MSNPSNLEKIIRNFKDPISQINWNQVTATEDLESVTIHPPFTIPASCAEVEKKLQTYIHDHTPDHVSWKQKKILFKTKVLSHKVANGSTKNPQIKNIISVTSTKGGVGKSTIASHLALSLQKAGCQVGILDADIYGPNIPNLLGPHQKATIHEDHYIPITQHDMAVMSMGYLVEKDTPLMWRGPMATAYLQQMLNKTQWPALDYLIIDMPPGTGDIQLTIAQKVPITAAILITTPQCLSLSDLEKGLGLLKKTQIPTLGLIENMGTLTCKHCKKENPLFSSPAVDKFIEKHRIPLLGSIPLDLEIAQTCEENTPLHLSNPNHKTNQVFDRIAYQMGFRLSQIDQHKPNPFPKIVIESKE